MKTPEEIKDGPGHCAIEEYNGCPYAEYECMVEDGKTACAMDALTYIQQLEDHIGDLTKMVPRWISVKERDDGAPAVDAEPERHGRWIFDKNKNDWGIGGYVCSECQAKNNNLPCTKVAVPLMFVGANYCPNCGAKMDEEKEEE